MDLLDTAVIPLLQQFGPYGYIAAAVLGFVAYRLRKANPTTPVLPTTPAVPTPVPSPATPAQPQPLPVSHPVLDQILNLILSRLHQQAAGASLPTPLGEVPADGAAVPKKSLRDRLTDFEQEFAQIGAVLKG